MFWTYHLVEFSEMTRRFLQRFTKARLARVAVEDRALRKAA
jgi:hypothetical protein